MQTHLSLNDRALYNAKIQALLQQYEIEGDLLERGISVEHLYVEKQCQSEKLETHF